MADGKNTKELESGNQWGRRISGGWRGGRIPRVAWTIEC
jgi:hypothetical protein